MEKDLMRSVEFIQQHKDALAGSKIALEKCKLAAEKGGITGELARGFYDGALPTVKLYEYTIEQYVAGDPVFYNWEAAKVHFMEKGKEFGMEDDLKDQVIDMLKTFF